MQLVTTNGHRYKAFLPLLRTLSDSAALKATAEALRSAGRWCHPAQGKATEMHHEPSFPVTFSAQRQQSFAKKKKKKLPRDSSNPQPVNSWAEGCKKSWPIFVHGRVLSRKIWDRKQWRHLDSLPHPFIHNQGHLPISTWMLHKCKFLFSDAAIFSSGMLMDLSWPLKGWNIQSLVAYRLKEAIGIGWIPDFTMKHGCFWEMGTWRCVMALLILESRENYSSLSHVCYSSSPFIA